MYNRLILALLSGSILCAQATAQTQPVPAGAFYTTAIRPWPSMTTTPTIDPAFSVGTTGVTLGTLAAGVAPLPTTSSLGGILANIGSTDQFVMGVNTSTGALIYGTPAYPVTSVAGHTGAVTLSHSDITDWASSTTTYLTTSIPAASGQLLGGSGTAGTAGAVTVGTGLILSGGSLSVPVGQSLGVAPLDTNGMVPALNLPLSVQQVGLSLAWGGIPTSGALTFSAQVPWACNIPANGVGTNSYVNTNATGTTTFAVSYIHSGTSTSIGNFVWTNASSSASIPNFSQITLSAGDLLIGTAPATPDTTWANGTITIMCIRS